MISLSTLIGSVYSERFAIEFIGDLEEAEHLARSFASVSGLAYHGRIGELRVFEFSVPDNLVRKSHGDLSVTRALLNELSDASRFSSPTHVLDDLNRLNSLSEESIASKRDSSASFSSKSFANRFGISWVQEQVASTIEKRKAAAVITDPLYASQYHLHRTSSSSVSLNVTGVWDSGITGAGIVVAIVDDGIQFTHPDIAPNYHPESSYNFDFGTTDPSPASMTFDYHGTSSAGVAAASADGSSCGVGVAFRAGLSGIAILQTNEAYDAKEARALQYALNVNHIYSNSWGPPDGGVAFVRPGPLTNQAIEIGVRSGRNGLGAIYVWAAGNGRREDNCNYDGYASKRQVVTVSAVNADGVRSSFAEDCAALLVVSPADSNSRSFIRTTDLLGSDGRNAGGDCHLSFSGTSAACPAVAGVVALMLEANPKLTWLDVQRILIDSAHRNDPSASSWNRNGAGRWASHDYGFGLADAYSAVQLAKQLAINNSASMTREVVLSYLNPDLVTFTRQSDFNNRFGAIFDINVTEDITLHHVEVFIDDLQTPDAGSLEVTLTSPSGFISTFAKPHRQNAPNLRRWIFTSRLFWGESSSGVWRFSILSANNGSIHTFSLRVWGTPNNFTSNSIYKRKNEVGEYSIVTSPPTALFPRVPFTTQPPFEPFATIPSPSHSSHADHLFKSVSFYLLGAMITTLVVYLV